MLNGKDISRYYVDWAGIYITYDPEFVKSKGKLGRSLPPEYIFQEDKILVQRTRRGMKRKLVCYLDKNKYYNLNRLSNIVLKDRNYSLESLYPLLNSKLLDFYFNVYFNEYEVKPLHLGQLPIATKLLTEIKLSKLGRTIQEHIGNLRSLLQNFTTYLQSQYPIEKLSRKLQSWHDLSFGDFIKELNKAIKTAGGEQLTKLKEMEWMDVFETKKAEAQALKSEIEKTDKEIDQMVYELYGLTEEEIGIVEGE